MNDPKLFPAWVIEQFSAGDTMTLKVAHEYHKNTTHLGPAGWSNYSTSQWIIQEMSPEQIHARNAKDLKEMLILEPAHLKGQFIVIQPPNP